MESQKKMMVVFGLVAAVCLQCVAAVTVHEVGANAWTVPPTPPFPRDQKFEVGDVLKFQLKHAKDAEEVYGAVEVTKDVYDACTNFPSTNHSGQAKFTTISTGQANFTLNSLGEHYFTCPFGSHCQSGLKFVIDVLASGTSPGSSPSAPSTSTTTSTASSSSPAAGAGFVLCSLSLVVGLFV